MKIHSFEQITIPTPCHENWETMTPEEKGRFCTVCNKTVYDFSNVSVEEFNRIVAQEEDRNICGQFRSQQIKSTHILKPKKTSEHSKITPIQLNEENETFFVKGDFCAPSGGITGKITSYRYRLDNASIDVYANNVWITSTKADIKGKYKITSLNPDNYTLTISKTGYLTLNIHVKVKHKMVKLNVILENPEMIRGNIKLD